MIYNFTNSINVAQASRYILKIHFFSSVVELSLLLLELGILYEKFGIRYKIPRAKKQWNLVSSMNVLIYKYILEDGMAGMSLVKYSISTSQLQENNRRFQFDTKLKLSKCRTCYCVNQGKINASVWSFCINNEIDTPTIN